jgi:hypothetical protein
MALVNKTQGEEQKNFLPEYTKEEIVYLLQLIKDSTFKGYDLPVLVSLVNKLQQHHKSL